ncbi:hypothetical protein [Methylomagnum ishizawai]|uniref:hypothetical protein n=1 Tax=Methylomagnum ishizawai TaxID=1760988 RepID=UPI001C328B92|nr:hypothetical protein [Methylomagnum ishizawai]BBL74607.1 hypothetical protein MishRS11D_17050 [Methylomagnum ishizawai]
MDRTKISIKNEESRLHLYGGCFDLVNGLHLPSSTIEDIKFSSLFYKHIVVPDGFFHCYGPLYSHYKNIKENYNSDDISKLLKAGIITPSLRTGESLYENWKNGGNIGITPGQFMIVDQADGDIIKTIDRYVSKYMHWPEDMGNANKIEFSRLIYDALVDENSNYSLAHKQRPSNLPFYEDYQWTKCEELIDEFIGIVTDNKDNPKFRRGDIEKLISKNLGIEMKSYKELNSRAINATRLHDLNFGVAYIISNLSTTTYEAYHATQFSTVGGLFPQHEDKLIEDGLYDYLVDLKKINIEHKEKRILFGTLDVNKLSTDEIIKFRIEEDELFDEYCKKVINIEYSSGVRFKDANNDFIDFLASRYIPTIIRKYPHCGYIEKSVKVAGDIAAIITFAGNDLSNLSSIKIGGSTLATYIAGVRVIERLTDRFKPVIQDIEGFLRQKYLVHKFKKGNYQRWNSE